jgi:hypothetical protein
MVMITIYCGFVTQTSDRKLKIAMELTELKAEEFDDEGGKVGPLV